MTESEAIEILRFAYPKERNRPITEEVISIAINALEKQITKKPKERDCIGYNILVCPVCKDVLYLYEPYCDNCGQAIDWSDE